MAVAVKAGSPTSNTVASGTSNTIAVPSGVAYGDFVLLRIGWVNTSGNLVDVPAGFTLLFDNSFSGWTQRIYGKLITNPSAELAATPYTFDFDATLYSDLDCTILSGADATKPVGDKTSNTGTGTTLTGLSCAVARSGSLLLLFTISSTGARTSGPAGMTNILTYDTNVYTDSLAINATGSGTGNKTSTYAASIDWIAHMILVEPPNTPNMFDVI